MLLRLSVALAFAIAVVQASEQKDGTGSKLIAPAGAGVLDRARNNAVQFETSIAASRRVLQVWLTHANPRTLLLPGRSSQSAASGSTRRITRARICIRI